MVPAYHLVYIHAKLIFPVKSTLISVILLAQIAIITMPLSICVLTTVRFKTFELKMILSLVNKSQFQVGAILLLSSSIQMVLAHHLVFTLAELTGKMGSISVLPPA